VLPVLPQFHASGRRRSSVRRTLAAFLFLSIHRAAARSGLSRTHESALPRRPPYRYARASVAFLRADFRTRSQGRYGPESCGRGQAAPLPPPAAGAVRRGVADTSSPSGMRCRWIWRRLMPLSCYSTRRAMAASTEDGDRTERRCLDVGKGWGWLVRTNGQWTLGVPHPFSRTTITARSAFTTRLSRGGTLF
jgi:hypothetical protein